MTTNTFSELKYSLNGYFLRQGLISRPVLNTDGLIRLASRVSGKACLIDKRQFLSEFACSHGIGPYKKRERKNPRRKKQTTHPFYLSKEWQALRYRLIRDSDGRCQACGATAKSSGRPMHVDHIIPRSIDPSKALEYSNLQLLCEACNLGKSNTDCRDWRKNA